MLVQAYNIIIYCGVQEPVHGREVVDGLNATYNFFISVLMTTVQLPGVEAYETQMEMYASTFNKDIIIAR